MDILTAVAIIISIFALSVTVWSAKYAREHNKLSLRPLLHIYALYGNAGEHSGSCLRNMGIGPAIITSVCLYTSDQKIQQGDEDWQQILTNLGLEWEGWAYTIISVGTVMHPKEEYWILEKEKTPDNSSSFHDQLAVVLKSIEVQISYKSLYDETQPEFRAHLAGMAAR